MSFRMLPKKKKGKNYYTWNFLSLFFSYHAYRNASNFMSKEKVMHLCNGKYQYAFKLHDNITQFESSEL